MKTKNFAILTMSISIMMASCGKFSSSETGSQLESDVKYFNDDVEIEDEEYYYEEDSEMQFYDAQYVMMYLSNNRFVSGDITLTFAYNGMYVNGQCQTGAIEVLDFDATRAICRAYSPYSGQITFFVDCQRGYIENGGDIYYAR